MFEKKIDLNISYNFSYNKSWIKVLLERIDRKRISITFNPHLFDRENYWNLDIDRIEETVRIGRIYPLKCKKPNKLCFRKYFGKDNLTYIIITTIHDNFIEVITAWPKKGN